MRQCKLIVAPATENRTCGVQEAAFFTHGAQNESSKEHAGAKRIIISLRENELIHLNVWLSHTKFDSQ
jgi:hypothetical protein